MNCCYFFPAEFKNNIYKLKSNLYIIGIIAFFCDFFKKSFLLSRMLINVGFFTYTVQSD